MREKNIVLRENNSTFGGILRNARHEKKYTQAELGEMICVDASTISSYERNRTKPDSETLWRLVSELGIPTEVISFNKGEQVISVREYQDSLLFQIYGALKEKDREGRKLILELCRRMN